MTTSKNPPKSKLIRKKIQTWNDGVYDIVDNFDLSTSTLGWNTSTFQLVGMMDMEVDNWRDWVRGTVRDHDPFGEPCNPKEAEWEYVMRLALIGLSRLTKQTRDKVLRDVAELAISKQHDYGPANINSFGMVGIVVRVSDKLARLRNLQGKKSRNEAALDTWADVIGYSLVAIMFLRGTFNLPLVDGDPPLSVGLVDMPDEPFTGLI